MWWGAVGRGSLESRWSWCWPRYLWFGSSVALDRLGRVGHGDHKSAPRRHAGRRSYLDDRAARRSYLDHLAGLDAGRERDADLHFLIARTGPPPQERPLEVVRAPRARARRRGKWVPRRAAGSKWAKRWQRGSRVAARCGRPRASLDPANSWHGGLYGPVLGRAVLGTKS